MSIKKRSEKKKVGLSISDVKSVVRKRKTLDFNAFLKYKRIVEPQNLLELANDEGYVAFLNIPGKDLDFINSEGSDGATEIIQKYHMFLNVYLDDWDVIISQLPADTKQQQISWADTVTRIDTELKQETDSGRKYDQIIARRQYAHNQIEVNTKAGEIITHQDYTALIYGKTISSTIEKRDKFIEIGAAALSPTILSKERILMLMSLLNNPVKNIERDLEGEKS